ncbi:MAG: hypothetical protein NC453_08400 [Muribaculum sp.]|nr:hypothetical protein [Muribaculum sp.]
MKPDCDVATIDNISGPSITTEERDMTEADFSPEYLAYLNEQMDKDLEEAYNEWFKIRPNTFKKKY